MKKLTLVGLCAAVLASCLLIGCGGGGWKQVSDFKPETGKYSLKLLVSANDEFSGAKSKMDMSGELEISGTNPDSNVTMTIGAGKVDFDFSADSYDDAKAMYSMVYGDGFKYDDANHKISGDMPEEMMGSFSNTSTYSDFMDLDGAKCYTAGSGKYKVVGVNAGQNIEVEFIKK